jgi:hypothetical protein
VANKRILEAFRRDGDGCWTCVESLSIDHPRGRIEVPAGTRIVPGQAYMGVPLAEWLEDLTGGGAEAR